MKKIWMIIGCFILCFFGTGFSAEASLPDDYSDYFSGGSADSIFSDEEASSGQIEGTLDGDYSEYFESSGANDLYRELPEETKSFLQENGISGLDSEELMKLDFGTFISILKDKLLSDLKKPLVVLSVTLGMVLLASMMGLLKTTSSDGTSSVFNVVSVLCIGGVVITPVVELVRQIISTVEQVSGFITSFIPVYAAVVAASGKPVSAFTYNTMLMSVTQVIAYIMTNILIPLICIYLALSLMGSATTQINIKGITKPIRSGVVWSLGLFITIFVSMLTIKSFVAGSADTVTFRAGKFVVSSLIPVVGGSVGDALSVVQGSLGVIKTSIGAFGILILLVTFLPILLELILMMFALKVAQAAGDSLDVPEVTGLLEAAQFALSMMLAVLVCFAMMLIISISLMLVLANGG